MSKRIYIISLSIALAIGLFFTLRPTEGLNRELVGVPPPKALSTEGARLIPDAGAPIAKTVSTRGLNKNLPYAREYYKDLFSPFVHEEGIPEATWNRVLDILIQKRSQVMDLLIENRRTGRYGSQVAEDILTIFTSGDPEIELLIGKDSFRKFVHYRQDLPFINLTNVIDDSLAAKGYYLSSVKREFIQAALIATRTEKHLKFAPTYALLVNPEITDSMETALSSLLSEGEAGALMELRLEQKNPSLNQRRIGQDGYTR